MILILDDEDMVSSILFCTDLQTQMGTNEEEPIPDADLADVRPGRWFWFAYSDAFASGSSSDVWCVFRTCIHLRVLTFRGILSEPKRNGAVLWVGSKMCEMWRVTCAGHVWQAHVDRALFDGGGCLLVFVCGWVCAYVPNKLVCNLLLNLVAVVPPPPVRFLLVLR